MKTKFHCCSFAALLLSGCGLFEPQETDAFGELQVNVRFAEANGQAALLAKGNAPHQIQALDRFVITIFSYTLQLEEKGNALARREILVGEDRRLSASVRVPLRSAAEDFFLAEVQAFQRGDLIYSGADIFQFNDTTKTARIEVFLQPVDFSASFFLQPNSPRFVLGQAFVFDTSVAITAFDFEGNGIGTTRPLGRASEVNNAILLWGDTTITKVRAQQLGVFRGEVTGRFAYTGPRADVLIACTWNQPLDFNLEVVNPQGQTISELSPGDVPEGSGVLLISSASYGPEAFEWRMGRITSGQFIVNVTRPNAAVAGNGAVHIIRREAQAQQIVNTVPFEFRLLDTQNTKQVFSFTWP